jgi:hypothetical protein
MLDPWLAETNFTGYLIGQFEDIQMNCSTTLPYTTSSSTLYIGTQTVSSTVVTTTASGRATATPTCLGQVVQALADSLTCNDLSDT